MDYKGFFLNSWTEKSHTPPAFPPLHQQISKDITVTWTCYNDNTRLSWKTLDSGADPTPFEGIIFRELLSSVCSRTTPAYFMHSSYQLQNRRALEPEPGFRHFIPRIVSSVFRVLFEESTSLHRKLETQAQTALLANVGRVVMCPYVMVLIFLMTVVHQS